MSQPASTRILAISCAENAPRLSLLPRQRTRCNKIVLGHHFDDVIETILMGMLYGAKIETMMPKLHSQHFEGMELIRPLSCRKQLRLSRPEIPTIFISSSAPAVSLRTVRPAEAAAAPSVTRDERAFIAHFPRDQPFIESNIFNSVQNVNLRTIIGYHKDSLRPTASSMITTNVRKTKGGFHLF